MRAEGATGATAAPAGGEAVQRQPQGPQQGAFSSSRSRSRSRSSKAAAGGAGDNVKCADEQLCLPSNPSPFRPLLACSSLMPTVPICGWLNTAVAMLVWSGLVGCPPNTVLVRAIASIRATAATGETGESV